MPGPGSGAGRPLATRWAARSRWVGFGLMRSRCASTIAPTAAVISRALVISNGYRYLVKIRLASVVTFPLPNLALFGAAGPITALPTTRLSRTSMAIPPSVAHSRWPRIVSMIESAAEMPTIIKTNRNSMRTAPV